MGKHKKLPSNESRSAKFDRIIQTIGLCVASLSLFSDLINMF